MPLVAPTKTATRPGGSAEGIREFEDWTSVRETIVRYYCKKSQQIYRADNEIFQVCDMCSLPALKHDRQPL